MARAPPPPPPPGSCGCCGCCGCWMGAPPPAATGVVGRAMFFRSRRHRVSSQRHVDRPQLASCRSIAYGVGHPRRQRHVDATASSAVHDGWCYPTTLEWRVAERASEGEGAACVRERANKQRHEYESERTRELLLLYWLGYRVWSVSGLSQTTSWALAMAWGGLHFSRPIIERSREPERPPEPRARTTLERLTPTASSNRRSERSTRWRARTAASRRRNGTQGLRMLRTAHKWHSTRRAPCRDTVPPDTRPVDCTARPGRCRSPGCGVARRTAGSTRRRARTAASHPGIRWAIRHNGTRCRSGSHRWG